jgi:hypothetical protein
MGVIMEKILRIIRGLRKWSIMLLIIIVGIIFRVNDLLNGVEFVALIKGVAIAFMSSNAIEHAKDMIIKKKEDMSED